MIRMEKLTKNIADKIAEELNLDNDNKEVIAYGMFALMHMALSVILVVIFGFILHVATEALIISFTVSILRKYSGGAHASSPGVCTFSGTVICIGQALLISVFIGQLVSPGILLILSVLTFSWSYYLIHKLAPVDSPAKPIKKQEKRQRMKKGSIFVLSIYLIIVVFNFVMYVYFKEIKFAVYSLCICGGTAWQAFTLTKSGHFAINKIDTFLNQILTIKKREGFE
jgi:accessory gene regulator B